jgi:RNA polymerase-binding transcription factor DksA
MITINELMHFKETLSRERKILQKEILFFLKNTSLESYKDLALSLEQTSENNWLDLLSTQGMKELKPIIKSLDKVEASLAQIDMGMFGLCADCESEIPKEILYRNPSHQRCTSCHQKYIERLSTR